MNCNVVFVIIDFSGRAKFNKCPYIAAMETIGLTKTAIRDREKEGYREKNRAKLD